MNKLILIIAFNFFAQFLYGQTRVDSLVQLGIKYHDKGEYDNAIESYKKALEVEPNSGLINYEIAMSYMYAKDYHNSIKHCDKVIELNDKYLVQVYITKGSCLDYLGNTDESIKLFEKGIKQFGANHLLYYNLGYNYYKLKNYENAQEALLNAIKTKSDHASSHLLLGYVMNDLNQRVQSLLCLHYFLFLEPNSERAKVAYSLLQRQFAGNIEKDKTKPNETHIFFDPNQSGKEFGAADLMISMLEASKTLDENKGKTDDELFIDKTTSFFKVLGELKRKKNKGLWWDFYIPFFYELAKSEHIDTYCYYISRSTNINASDWLTKNTDKLERFAKWLKEK
ncbi:MAG: tetratricopeptide repeat protein [Bacteroidetes bacterium]|nr:tetratricopeptide repeat protein [Bacteroidota bacterium]